MFIGLMTGVYNSTPSTFGLYGVTILFLIGFSEYFQWLLRQLITSESLMISSERAFEIINL